MPVVSPVPLSEVDPDLLALLPVEIDFSPGPKYHESARKWQGIPGIERAPNGRLWASWYTGGRTEDENNHVVLVTSADDGATWSEPVLAIDPPGDIRASDPVLWHDPLGRLWLFWMQTAHCGVRFDGRAGVWAIRCEDSAVADAGWSPPLRVANGIMMNKPTVLSTGEWLLPCAIWIHLGPYHHTMHGEQFSNIICSKDEGETFHLIGSADVPNRGCDEHMVIERRDGSLWMLVRRKDGIGEAVSHDRGRTWKASPDAVLEGPNARFHIRRLRSGRLLLLNHYGFTGRSHLTALLSDDDGRTWPHHLLLDERKLVTYPDAVETPEGKIYMIYDRQRTGEGEILLQTFTEEDILLNRTPGYKQRKPQIISQVSQIHIGNHAVSFAENTLIDLFMEPAEWLPSEASVRAVGEEGEVGVDPVRFTGDTMRLDCAIAEGGSLRVEMRSSCGNPIPGYTRDDFEEITGSPSEWVVRWKEGRNLSPLEGELVRIRFVLKDAAVYGFQFFRNSDGFESD